MSHLPEGLPRPSDIGITALSNKVVIGFELLTQMLLSLRKLRSTMTFGTLPKRWSSGMGKDASARNADLRQPWNTQLDS